MVIATDSVKGIIHMNASPSKLDDLYPKFLSSVLKGIRSEAERIEKFKAVLHAACSTALEAVDNAFDQLSSADLSAKEQSMLAEADGFRKMGVVGLHKAERTNDGDPRPGALAAYKNALDNFNKALARMEEVRKAYFIRQERNAQRRAAAIEQKQREEEALRKQREEEALRKKREEEARREKEKKRREVEERNAEERFNICRKHETRFKEDVEKLKGSVLSESETALLEQAKARYADAHILLERTEKERNGGRFSDLHSAYDTICSRLYKALSDLDEISKSIEKRRVLAEEDRIRKRAQLKYRIAIVLAVLLLVPLGFGVYRHPCWTFLVLAVASIPIWTIPSFNNEESERLKGRTPVFGGRCTTSFKIEGKNLKGHIAVLGTLCIVGMTLVILRQTASLHWTASLLGFVGTILSSVLLTHNRGILTTVPFLLFSSVLALPSPLVPFVVRHPYLIGIPLGIVLLVYLSIILVSGSDNFAKYYKKSKKIFYFRCPRCHSVVKVHSATEDDYNGIFTPHCYKCGGSHRYSELEPET